MLLGACTSSMVSPTAKVRPANYVQVPDKDFKILMPSQAMQDKIAALVEKGEAPAYLELPQENIDSICGPDRDHLLGCTFESALGKSIFITDRVSGEAKRMLLVHEYAHYLYDWHHA